MYNLLFSKHYLEHRIHRQYAQEFAAIESQAEQAWQALKGRWQAEKGNLPNLPEAELESRWIRPLLNDLWGADNYQGQLQARGNQPDVVFYPDKAARDQAAKAKGNGRYAQALVVGEAEKWGKDLDKPEGAKKESPHGQIRRYLGLKPEWGLLTNGREWRLYNQNVRMADKSWVAFDLADMLDRDDFDAFLTFFFLFEKNAFPHRVTAIQSASNRYVTGVSGRLRVQAFDALEAIMTGWYAQDSGRGSTPEGLQQLYGSGLVYLYRLLFILYAESRELLPLSTAYYRTDYSLGGLIDAYLLNAAPLDETEPAKTQLFGRLDKLFKAINDGEANAGIEAYNGGLFKPNGVPGVDAPFVGQTLSNKALGRAIRALAFADGEQVDYYDLAIQQLGTLYEGLLEQTPAIGVDENGDACVRLAIDREERKLLGGFYTPDDVAAYIVQQTLEPLITQSNGSYRTSAEILQVRVLDPAMGSGQFLLHTLDALAYAAAKADQAVYQSQAEPDEGSLADYRRKAAVQCIYGVDVNPLAVELAKLGVWLATAAKDKPLSFLDHHLRCGNSLIGANLTQMDAHPRPRQRKQDAGTQLGLFEPLLRQKLPQMIARQLQISAQPANTLTDIQKQQQAYDELMELRRPFDQAADAWTAITGGAAIKEKDYALMLSGLSAPKQMAKDPVVRQTEAEARRAKFFHWGLAFPEIFYEQTSGGEAVNRESAGFDAIVGNPPYVRQELIRAEKPYLKAMFSRTHSGAADLYVYFFEQAFARLLRPDGQFGVICSNKFMRAGYGRALREFLAEKRLRELIDFGDSPIFPEAVTYPVVVVAQNSPPTANHAVRALPAENAANIRQGGIGAAMAAQSSLSWDQPQATLHADGWTLARNDTLALFEKLKAAGTPLGDYVDRKFYRGVLTGLNDAFVITAEQRGRLIAQDARSVELIKPWIRGRDIKRWRIEDDEEMYVIFARRGVDIKQYPAIEKHLKRWKKQLTPKRNTASPVGRKPGSYQWFEIQDNIAYWQEFEKPKIVWPDIATSPRFAYDDSCYYGGNTLYIMPAPELWLIGLLNSAVIQFFFEQISSSIRGDYLRFIASYMEQLPIPNASEVETQAIETQARQVMDLAAQRLKLQRDTRHRFFDLDSKKSGKLNQALTKWWELADFAAFQAAINTAFKSTIPVADRQSWEDYLQQQQTEHVRLTAGIAQCEREINTLVYQLFGLSQQEIQVIEQASPYQYGAL